MWEQFQKSGAAFKGKEAVGHEVEATLWRNENVSEQGDFPLHWRPRAPGKQICCENPSAFGFRQQQHSAEPCLLPALPRSRIHPVREDSFLGADDPFPPCGLRKKRQEKSQRRCWATPHTRHSELSWGFCISSPHHQGASSSELQTWPRRWDSASQRRERKTEKLRDTIPEADRILSPLAPTGLIQVHNVISSSEMACLKAYLNCPREDGQSSSLFYIGEKILKPARAWVPTTVEFEAVCLTCACHFPLRRILSKDMTRSPECAYFASTENKRPLPRPVFSLENEK